MGYSSLYNIYDRISAVETKFCWKEVIMLRRTELSVIQKSAIKLYAKWMLSKRVSTTYPWTSWVHPDDWLFFDWLLWNVPLNKPYYHYLFHNVFNVCLLFNFSFFILINLHILSKSRKWIRYIVDSPAACCFNVYHVCPSNELLLG